MLLNIHIGGSGNNFNIPDLRGYFIRTFGGQSSSIGIAQSANVGSFTYTGSSIATVYVDLGGGGWDGWAYGPNPQAGGWWTSLPGGTTSSGETRPINKAFHCFIKY